MATVDDRKVVATRLVDDLLKTTGKTDFKLTSLESPSLDEAMQMAQDACTLALSVHRDDGLDEQCETRLLDWLVNRQVAVESGEQTIPFERFEVWVAEHEERLLPLLGGRYPTQVAEEIESGGALKGNVPEALRRSRAVFDRLLASGEESRPELWSLLTRFIKHGDCAFVEFASGYVLASATHASRPSPAALTGFLVAFGERLQSPPEGLDLNDRGQCFNGLVIARQDDLQDGAKDTLTALVSSWGSNDAMADLASTLASSLHGRFPDAATPILNDWTGRVLSNLPNPCIAWLARSFGSILNDNQRQRLVQQFNPVHENDNVPPDQAARYIHFMRSAPAETLKRKRIQSNLTSLCQQIAQRHANPNNYLDRVFPVVPHVLDHVPASVAASTLSGLFPNTKDRPDLLAWLHGEMEGHWPKPNDDMPGYNPVQLFDEAAGVLRSSPAGAKMPGLLRSISSMVKNGVVPPGKQQGVANAACVMWQHHSDEARQIITEHEAVPEAPLVAAMIEGVSEDDASYDALEAVWTVIGKRSSVEHCITTAIALLHLPSR